MKKFLFFLPLLLSKFSFSQIENYYLSNKTPEYKQVIRFYDSISKKCPNFKWLAYGTTDAGIPLNLLVISKDKVFDPAKIHAKKKAVLLINNGIHPGEPDGIDACLNIAKAYARNPKTIPDSVVICIVPIFNIDGALNRNSVMRMNQNGPEEFGFRGNGKNLDLNRDFVKCDAENTKSLIQIFHEWKPELFIDTHVSNGADYQYTMTVIFPDEKQFPKNIVQALTPMNVSVNIEKEMKSMGQEVCTYVECVKNIPDDGISQFNQTPRYSTGFTSLFNCISFVTESHMLKPYPQRVKATIDILRTSIHTADSLCSQIVSWKKKRDGELKQLDKFFINWKNDTTVSKTFPFKGYEAGYKQSSISGFQRLYYDRSKPFTRDVKFYPSFIAKDTIEKPDYYVIPQAYKNVIDILKINNVAMTRLKNDTTMNCEIYYITDYKTGQRPYEGHYVHTDVKVRKEKQQLKFLKGDYLIKTDQASNRYLIETLEPNSDDGFFAWNFFDGILQQKEWFSDYAFEETAEQIIKEDPSIKTKLDSAKAADKNLKESHWAQLNFIFQNSKYKEKTHNRYPVARIVK